MNIIFVALYVDKLSKRLLTEMLKNADTRFRGANYIMILGSSNNFCIKIISFLKFLQPNFDTFTTLDR